MHTPTLSSTLLFLLFLAGPFLHALPVAVPAPDDVLVPKGATLNARSIPELLALKRANEKRKANSREFGNGFGR